MRVEPRWSLMSIKSCMCTTTGACMGVFRGRMVHCCENTSMRNAVLRAALSKEPRAQTWRCTAAIRRSFMHRHSCSIWTVRGESASHDSWQWGRRTEALFLVFLNPLPRIARHPTTLTSDEVRHMTPNIPLVEVGPFYFLKRGPTLSSLARLANKPPGTHMRRSHPYYSVLPSAMEAPPSVVRPCIRLRGTPFHSLWRRRWRRTSRKAVWLG